MLNNPAASFSPSPDGHFRHLMKQTMQISIVSSHFPTRLLSPHPSKIEILKLPLLCVYTSMYLSIEKVFTTCQALHSSILYIHFPILIIQQSHEDDAIVISPFERGGNWGSEKLNNSSVVTRLVGGRASTQVCLTPKPMLSCSSG